MQILALPTVLVLAFVSFSAPSQAIVAPTDKWIAPGQARPSLSLLATPHGCARDEAREACNRRNWLDFLGKNRLTELQAPAGGRAYRWMWSSAGNGTGWVEVMILSDQKAEIRSHWNPDARSISPVRFILFEAALARTEFAQMRSDSILITGCLDECEDQIMEAVVGGRYQVAFPFHDVRIASAGRLLEGLARESASVR